MIARGRAAFIVDPRPEGWPYTLGEGKVGQLLAEEITLVIRSQQEDLPNAAFLP